MSGRALRRSPGALPAPRLAGVLSAAAAIVAPAAQAAASASYSIANAVVDAAGGTSASPHYQVTACVGSEIAGAQASASFRIDSGCGPSALALPRDFPKGGAGGGATGIPAVSDLGLVLLFVALAASAARQLRAPRA